MPTDGHASARYMLFSDAVLAGLAAGGDLRAFGDLVRRHGPAMHDLLRRMGATSSLADDISQDALVAAFRAIRTYRAEASFSTWLKKIAARLYVRRRRGDLRPHLATEQLDDDAPGDHPGLHSDGRMDLESALAQLGPIERVCVSLCHGAGFTQVEIAEVLAIPLGTVKSHVLRGMVKLRRLLDAPVDVRGVA